MPLQGAPTGFVENTKAAFSAVSHNDRSISGWGNLKSAYDDYLADVEKQTGKQFDNPMLATSAPVLGIESLGDSGRAIQAARQKLDADLVNLHETGGGFDLKRGQDLEQAIRNQARELETAAEDVGNRADGLGTLGQFTGSMGAAFTDPPLMATLFAGAPAAAGFLRTAIIEGAIGATTEAAIQPTVQAYRQELGLEYGLDQAAQNIALGAAGGAALSPIAKLAGMGTTKLLDVWRKTRKQPSQAEQDAAAMLQRQEEMIPAGVDPEVAAANLDKAMAAGNEGRPLRDDELVSVDPAPADVAVTPAATADPAVRAGSARDPLGVVDDTAPWRLPRRTVERVRNVSPALDDGQKETIKQLAHAIQWANTTNAESRLSGELSDFLKQAESTPITPFLDALRGKGPGIGAGAVREKPLIHAIKAKGGLHPEALDRAELEHIGITPKTVPGFFSRKSEHYSLDSLGEVLGDSGLFPEVVGGGRIAPDELVESLRGEMAGQPRRDLMDDEALANQQLLDDLDQAINEAGIDLSLPDWEIQNQLDHFAVAAREALQPLGREYGQAVDPQGREAAAVLSDQDMDRAAEIHGDLYARNLAELHEHMAANDDFEVVIDFEMNQATKQIEPVKIRARDLLNQLDMEEETIEAFAICAGVK